MKIKRVTKIKILGCWIVPAPAVLVHPVLASLFILSIGWTIFLLLSARDGIE